MIKRENLKYPFYPSPSVKFLLCPLKYCHYSLNPGSCKTFVNPTARGLWAPTMSNKHLLTSLSSVLRRTLTPTSHFSFNYTRWFQSGTFFSPNVKTHHRLFPCSGLDFLEIHNIPGKCFTSSQSAEKASAKCWNCSAAAEAVPFLLCSSCRCIQPVDQSVDYFQIFGL